MTTIIIPSRIGSTRLKNKPLIDINGVKLIERVFDQCSKSNINKVYVASDHQDILNLFPKQYRVMTSKFCTSGTDRVAEATEILGIDENEVIINVQGDMPFIPPELINDFSKFMINRQLGTVAFDKYTPVNGVNVVTDVIGNAIYFSRGELKPNGVWHIGMYGYSVEMLRRFRAHNVSPLEKGLSLEQMRFIDYNIHPIAVMRTSIHPGMEINTEEDIAIVNREVNREQV